MAKQFYPQMDYDESKRTSSVEPLNRRKLRKLMKTDDIPEKDKKAVSYFRASVAIALIVFAWSVLSTTTGFFQTYLKHYNQIINTYCNTDVNVQTLFRKIQENDILHQEKAIRLLETSFYNLNEFNAFSLVGPPGVGKSLFARAIAKNFPWKQNVHTYAWNTLVPDESNKFHVLRLFITNLSNCGRNLLIIDNLQPCDNEVVSIVNDIFLYGEGNYPPINKTATVIYIFTLSTMRESHYMHDYQMLQHLPNTTAINFKRFGVVELKDCIRREAKLADLVLTVDDFDEIIKTINPDQSGCKGVRAKVLLYGKQQNIDRLLVD